MTLSRKPSASQQQSSLPVSQPAPPPRSAAKPKLEPLSAKRYKLQLTASQALDETLKTAQHLLKHQLPAGDIDVVLERALDKLKKQRFAAGSIKPRASKTRTSKLQRKRTAGRDVLA